MPNPAKKSPKSESSRENNPVQNSIPVSTSDDKPDGKLWEYIQEKHVLSPEDGKPLRHLLVAVGYAHPRCNMTDWFPSEADRDLHESGLVETSDPETNCALCRGLLENRDALCVGKSFKEALSQAREILAHTMALMLGTMPDRDIRLVHDVDGSRLVALLPDIIFDGKMREFPQHVSNFFPNPPQATDPEHVRMLPGVIAALFAVSVMTAEMPEEDGLPENVGLFRVWAKGGWKWQWREWKFRDGHNAEWIDFGPFFESESDAQAWVDAQTF